MGLARAAACVLVMSVAVGGGRGAAAVPAPAGVTVCSSSIPVARQACDGVNGLAGGAAAAVGQVAGAGAGAALDGLASWSRDGADWLVGQVGPLLDEASVPVIGASWYAGRYRAMAGLAALLVLPLLLLAIGSAAIRHDPGAMVRAVALHLPVALIVTGAGIALVQLGLAVTDAMCAAITSATGSDTAGVLGTIVGASRVVPGLPPFVGLVLTLVMALAALVLLLELILRSAAISLAVLFLPLSLAGMVWPATAHWCRRLVEMLVGLILAKFVVVAVLSLAAGSLAAGAQGPGFRDLATGIVLLLLAVAAPYAVLRLVPIAEVASVAHLENISRRARSVVPGPAALANLALPEPPVGETADPGLPLAEGDIPYPPAPPRGRGRQARSAESAGIGDAVADVRPVAATGGGGAAGAAGVDQAAATASAGGSGGASLIAAAAAAAIAREKAGHDRE